MVSRRRRYPKRKQRVRRRARSLRSVRATRYSRRTTRSKRRSRRRSYRRKKVRRFGTTVYKRFGRLKLKTVFVEEGIQSNVYVHDVLEDSGVIDLTNQNGVNPTNPFTVHEFRGSGFMNTFPYETVDGAVTMFRFNAASVFAAHYSMSYRQNYNVITSSVNRYFDTWDVRSMLFSLRYPRMRFKSIWIHFKWTGGKRVSFSIPVVASQTATTFGKNAQGQNQESGLISTTGLNDATPGFTYTERFAGLDHSRIYLAYSPHLYGLYVSDASKDVGESFFGINTSSIGASQAARRIANTCHQAYEHRDCYRFGSSFTVRLVPSRKADKMSSWSFFTSSTSGVNDAGPGLSSRWSLVETDYVGTCPSMFDSIVYPPISTSTPSRVVPRYIPQDQGYVIFPCSYSCVARYYEITCGVDIIGYQTSVNATYGVPASVAKV